jgi:hypothetical protein
MSSESLVVTISKPSQFASTSLTLASILCLTACTGTGSDGDDGFTSGLDGNTAADETNGEPEAGSDNGDGDPGDGDPGDGDPGDGDGDPGDGDPGDGDPGDGDPGVKFDLGTIGDLGDGQGGNFGPGSCRSSEIYGASGGFPAFEDPLYEDYLEKTIAIVTHNQNAGLNPQAVLSIVDISGDPPPPNLNYLAPLYNHPTWTVANLGRVFGITLDSFGNIYLAPSTVWGATQNPGTIKRIDGITGAISDFATIPNNGPALGNLNYDCVSETVYVSNHEDGRIYQIDMDGDVVSTYHHGSGDVTMGEANDPGEPNGGFAPLGERPWAVQSNAGRLYYSVWVESGGGNANENNSVWSVAYVSSSGVPDPATAVKELEVPSTSGSSSQPVSDISFAHNGWMLVAQRSMGGDMSTSAHQSTTFEYDYQNGDWIFQGTTYVVGELLPYSAAGGVDHDFIEDGYVWMTGDALDFYTPNCVYGLQGTPYGGGGIATSTLIDMDHEITQQDKTAYGDVELPIPGDVNPVPPPG